jgi:transcriptional regulator with XRE-family HTH domain
MFGAFVDRERIPDSLWLTCSMRTPQPRNLNRLWIARKKMGLAQKSVARLLGYKSISPISEYETGRLIPSLRTAFKFSILYNCALPDLYALLYREIEDEINGRRQHVAPAKRHSIKCVSRR